LVWLPPREGEGQRWEVLRSLALVSLGSRPLAELLAGMRHYCGTGGPALEQYTSLVIITPAVDTAWVEALVPLLRRGVIPTVLLLDPVSFARPEPFDPSAELRTGSAQDRPFDPSTESILSNAEGLRTGPSTGLRTGFAQDKQSQRVGTGNPSTSSGQRLSVAQAQSPELASSRACRGVEGLLVDLGVTHYVITPDLLDRPEARPDQQRHRGRPASVHQPREVGWKVMS
jgi:hypothetical protein